MTSVASKKYFIVNADDFGLSAAVNAGIIEAHKRGIVTSASLMVRWPAAADAAAYAREHPEFSVGLHIDLGEWIYADGEWRLAYEVVPIHDAVAVAGEIAQQLQQFRQLLGWDPTHLDSHQHVHRDDPARSIVLQAGEKLDIPVRHLDSRVQYNGSFYGQSNKGDPYPEGISFEALANILNALTPGVTELGCHPGKGGEIRSVYGRERQVECDTLCDPRLAPVLAANEIALCSFSQWPLLAPARPLARLGREPVARVLQLNRGLI